MKAPLARHSPINQARKESWLNDFVGYRTAVNQGRIEAFLEQFSAADQDIVARVLDCVEFFGPDRIAHAFRTGLAALPGWHQDATQRAGRWRFAAMSQSAGASGDTMLHQFRVATGMDRRSFDDLFIHSSSLLRERLGESDSVVLLDDFVGTGTQVIDAWQSAFAELVAGIGNVYLMIVAARSGGRQRVRQETALQILAAHEFTDADNLFADECQHFTAEEKAVFRRYCKRASKKTPAGYGDCGLLVVFSHRCPNNTVAALHVVNQKWRGLFPRSA